jgi:two-component system, OmpR family, response regulator
MEKLVFFVDDDKMMLNLLEYTLKNRRDFEVKTFFSGEECLKNLELKPDLIVLDHIFKTNGANRMTGMEVLIEIKKRNKSLPVVILTSQEDENVAKEFITKGASRYIPKNDYFIDALMEAIDQQFS